MWARVVPRVIPEMSPRASGSHCGEPSPVSAGTKSTPSVDSTLAASASVSAARLDQPEPVAQPLDRRAADENRALGANCGAPPARAAAAVSRPSPRIAPCSPRLTSTNVPVP